MSYLLTNDYLKHYKKTLKESNLVVAPKSIAGKGNKGSDIATLSALLMFKNQGSPYNKLDGDILEKYVK